MVKENFPESIALYGDLISSSMKSFGLKTVEANIYSFVFCSLKPISLDDVSVGTGYSLATVSTVCKYLSDFHLLKREKRPGSKKVFLTAQRNVSEMIVDKFSLALKYAVKPKKDSLPTIIESLKKELRVEKSPDKKMIGREYLKLLESDLQQTLLLEQIHNYIIDYISKKSKNM